MITEATLIRDLIEVEWLNQMETAVLLERHKSWVCRRLQLDKTWLLFFREYGSINT